MILVAIITVVSLGLIIRPFGVPEWLWATSGALAALGTGLVAPAAAWRAVLDGYDVYLFLIGMLLLAEVARGEGLFDWLAVHAARAARGSQRRLFVLIYAVSVVVTVFLSNDATAVVLTPAVYAVTRAAKVDATPYVLICAFVANAASFVLPISNPANLVVFGSAMPPLGAWLTRFLLPSLVAIVVTFLMLRWHQRRALGATFDEVAGACQLEAGGTVAAIGLAVGAVALILASAFGYPLGLPTLAAGVGTLALTALVTRTPPLAAMRSVSWGVLPLVAALFVVVGAIEASGWAAVARETLISLHATSPTLGVFAAGTGFGAATNVFNNLPVGLFAGGVNHGGAMPRPVADALLIGVDLGPNLSLSGSLATILWLQALRREGMDFGAVRFLAVGAVVMPPALIAALLAVALAAV